MLPNKKHPRVIWRRGSIRMKKTISTQHGTGKDPNNSSKDEEQTPRWVKVFGVIAIVLVLVVVILHLTGGGFGGHGVHQP